MADSTEFEKRKEEEYEMQLLGFHSRTAYTTLQNIVQDTINEKCKKLCKTLQTKYDSNPEKLIELKENEEKLIQLYFTRAIPHLKIIENTTRKFICIPKNILLEEDKCQKIQYTDEEFQRLQEKLEDLQRRAKRVAILNAALNEELAIADQLQNTIVKNNKMCDIIENSSTIQATNSNMSIVLERYKELDKQLSTSVTQTQKEKYNPIENFKGKICNFDNS